MEQRLVRKVLHIGGMSCTSCEIKIENTLKKLEGIIEVKAIFSSSNVYITYDANVIEPGRIIGAIEELDYKVENKPGEIASQTVAGKAVQDKMSVNQLLGVGIILFSLYVIIKNTVGFNFIPEVNQSMGYGILFAVGLLTSLHCIAMCGGINLSQCVSHNPGDNNHDKFAKLKPSLLYNGGRVVSYTVIGGVVGALGSVVGFSGAARGTVAIAAGVFMVIMGLNMLNIFPWLRKLTPRMPRIFGNKVHNNNGKYGPFYIGLLNGLMPCGPLQTMQIYALGTGSPVAGALSMFMFSMGTVPLMFGFGAVSSMISGKFTHKMMKVSAVLVMVLGVVMANRGLALSGVNFALASSSPSSSSSASENVAKIQGGIQVVTTELESGRYTPFIVQKGIPVKWTIKVEKGDLNGCNNPLTIPQYGIQKKLSVGDNIIEFTPDSEGDVLYTCWMGMIRSNIKVVSDLSNASGKDIEYESDGGSTGGVSISTDEVAVGQIKDGIQYISINVNDNSFSPAVVVMQKGINTKWVINGKELNSHNSTLIFPEYGATMDINQGENEIEFVPEGDFSFRCSIGTLNGYVKVVDDINKIDTKAIKKEAENYQPPDIWSGGNGGGGGCH